MNDSLPFFADSTIVGDYKPLIKYWELVRFDRELLDKAFLNRSDFEYLKEVVESNPGISVAELLDLLINRFIPRINCEYARKAYVEIYSIDTSEIEACRNIAKILAGWLVEAGRNTGILKYRYSWRKESSVSNA